MFTDEVMMKQERSFEPLNVLERLFLNKKLSRYFHTTLRYVKTINATYALESNQNILSTSDSQRKSELDNYNTLLSQGLNQVFGRWGSNQTNEVNRTNQEEDEDDITISSSSSSEDEDDEDDSDFKDEDSDDDKEEETHERENENNNDAGEEELEQTDEESFSKNNLERKITDKQAKEKISTSDIENQRQKTSLFRGFPMLYDRNPGSENSPNIHFIFELQTQSNKKLLLYLPRMSRELLKCIYSTMDNEWFCHDKKWETTITYGYAYADVSLFIDKIDFECYVMLANYVYPHLRSESALIKSRLRNATVKSNNEHYTFTIRAQGQKIELLVKNFQFVNGKEKKYVHITTPEELSLGTFRLLKLEDFLSKDNIIFNYDYSRFSPYKAVTSSTLAMSIATGDIDQTMCFCALLMFNFITQYFERESKELIEIMIFYSKLMKSSALLYHSIRKHSAIFKDYAWLKTVKHQLDFSIVNYTSQTNQAENVFIIDDNKTSRSTATPYSINPKGYVNTNRNGKPNITSLAPIDKKFSIDNNLMAQLKHRFENQTLAPFSTPYNFLVSQFHLFNLRRYELSETNYLTSNTLAKGRITYLPSIFVHSYSDCLDFTNKSCAEGVGAKQRSNFYFKNSKLIENHNSNIYNLAELMYVRFDKKTSDRTAMSMANTVNFMPVFIKKNELISTIMECKIADLMEQFVEGITYKFPHKFEDLKKKDDEEKETGKIENI